MYWQIHVYHPLADQIHNVEILEMPRLVLVCLVILEIRQFVGQNVPSIRNARVIPLV